MIGKGKNDCCNYDHSSKNMEQFKKTNNSSAEKEAEDYIESRVRQSRADYLENIRREEEKKKEKEENEYKQRGIPDSVIELLFSEKINKEQKRFIKQLPWESIGKKPVIDPILAQTILQSDHIGMEEVKRRIMDYIRSDFRRGAVLLFVGPPGVGKTSLARKIATAVGRPSYEIALSGIASAHEITGVDPTFNDALPGEIIRAIISTNSFYPLIILDEIDKVGHSKENGDPQNALLEVLDTNRSSFRDRFINISVDLSNVIFIATANDKSDISPVLLDRLEVIEISGYNQDTKKRILSDQIIPKISSEIIDNPSVILNIDESAIQKIVREYSVEPGIRGLNDCIDIICRRANTEYQINGSKVIITADNLENYLGQPKVISIPELNRPKVGCVSTAIQISTRYAKMLSIQAELTKGSGRIICTGGIEGFASEAVAISKTIICRLAKENIILMQYNFFEENDIHVHSEYHPTSKKDNSVSLAILVALLSKKQTQKIPQDTMFIGDLDLSGSIRYVSNIGEYIDAAIESNITTVVIPRINAIMDSSIIDNYKKTINIEPVEDVYDIISKYIIIHK